MDSEKRHRDNVPQLQKSWMETKGDKAMKTETEVKHTPTPWKQEGRAVKGGEYEAETINISLTGKPGKIQMTKSYRVRFTVMHEEDADFIVRAVNSHEDLLDIAKMALDVANRGDGFQQGVKGIHHGIAYRLAKVIKQAEGKS